MNREKIIEMLRDAYERGQSDLMESCKEAAAQAIAVAVAAEREACAKVCEELRDDWFRGLGRYEFMGEGADFCADAIRARGETK